MSQFRQPYPFQPRITHPMLLAYSMPPQGPQWSGIAQPPDPRERPLNPNLSSTYSKFGNQPVPRQEVCIYKTSMFSGYANRKYERDLKKRQKAGWRLVSCTETGRDMFKRPILTAIYER